MQKLVANLIVLILGLAPAFAAQGVNGAPVKDSYYWKSAPVGSSARLHTLFCDDCLAGEDVPVLSVLQDTLGDADPENDRLIYVWLLDYSPLNWRQRMLAALPFFYWRVGKGSNKPEKGDVRPLINLASPLHSVMSGTDRQLVQWTLFDPMATSVRAVTHTYTENQRDHERVRLEQAISYLSKAPANDDRNGLKQPQLDLLMARLSLRKRLLGGIVSNEQAARIGDAERISADRIRVRNWEYLREASDRAGLVFEPLKMSGRVENYAMVWYRIGSKPPPPSGIDAPAWRILSIQNPWKDERLKRWRGLTVEREIDGQNAILIPLAAYSLTYPRRPLLMVDFRSEGHVRRRVMLQRTQRQLVNGILGLSHFANWYYFAGSDLYSFYVTRRGAALNGAERLDCYAEFRSALALDTTLPAELRSTLQSRLDQIDVNPLDASPDVEVQTARARYTNLLNEVQSGELMKQLELERREEVAEFGKGGGHVALDAALHALTFGAYTHKAAENGDMLARLDENRRINSNLVYLDRVIKSGTAPEVEFDPQRVSASVNELAALLPSVRSEHVRARASSDLNRIQQLTADQQLRTDCAFALHSIAGPQPEGIAARPRAVMNATIADGHR